MNRLTRDYSPSLKLLSAIGDDPDTREWARHAVKPEWFVDPQRRELFVIASEYARPEPFEPIYWFRAMSARLGCSLHDLSELFCDLMASLGVPENRESYARHMRDDYERLRLATVAESVKGKIADRTFEPDEIAAYMRASSEIVSERHADDYEIVFGGTLESRRATSGIVPTGFGDLDRLLSPGLAPGWLVTVAGRTGMGKTSFAMDLLRHACASGIPSGIVSLEMNASDLQRRFDAVFSAHEAPVRVWEPRQSIAASALDAKLRQWTADGIGLVVVDHLQLLVSPKQGQSKYEAVSENVHEIKRLARRFEIPIVLLSQLSRQTTQRSDRFPELGDLRDTGVIEEDSDVVILLHRPGYYDRAKDPQEAVADVAKNRHGQTGLVRLSWIASMASFANCEERTGG